MKQETQIQELINTNQHNQELRSLTARRTIDRERQSQSEYLDPEYNDQKTHESFYVEARQQLYNPELVKHEVYKQPIEPPPMSPLKSPDKYSNILEGKPLGIKKVHEMQAKTSKNTIEETEIQPVKKAGRPQLRLTADEILQNRRAKDNERKQKKRDAAKLQKLESQGKKPRDDDKMGQG